MALTYVYNNLRNLWPLSIFKFDDLRESERLVQKLSIPKHTKRFVYAVRDRESQSVIYILCTENLSERSAIDAEFLIREVRPEAVVAQVGNLGLSEIQSGKSELDNYSDEPVPTSSFGVLKRCFVDKVTKDKYESLAGNIVLREIFGVGFHEHVFTAKDVAKEVGSLFLVLPAFVGESVKDNSSSGEVNAGSKVQSLATGLVSHNVGLMVLSRPRGFYLSDDVQLQMVKLLSSWMDVSLPKLSPSSSVSVAKYQEIPLASSFQVPSFANSFYPLLMDLHNIFHDLPSIGTALAFAQKMLHDVSKGEAVDTTILSEVYTFRVAVEGLRVALNNAGRLPIPRSGKLEKAKIEFSELPVQDKEHALLAHALQSQTKKFKTVVAIVDACGLAGLRKHWNTPVPPEVNDLVEQLVYNCESDEEVSESTDKKWQFSNKPVVAVGAGATAVLGASSLSKVIPVSTFMKVVTLKIPASLKLMLLQTQRTMGIAMSKTLLPSKIITPGLANSGASASPVIKTAVSTNKIRMVAHNVIASVEKTSFSAMRTAFYEIMRKRRVQHVGVLPWVTFGCSIATCSGLFIYGDGIECAAESFPAAPSIASLGRGIQSLHQASQIAGQTDGTRIQKSIELLMHRLWV